MLLALDILVFIFGVIGALLVIKKNKYGFVSFIIHSVLWGILSVASGNYWAALTCVIFIIIDAYGFIAWTKSPPEVKKC